MDISKHNNVRRNKFAKEDSSDDDSNENETLLLQDNSREKDGTSLFDQNELAASYYENTVRVRLERNHLGFGLNIVGGIGNQINRHDPGIYVSNITLDSPAHLDGQIQAGDKIVAINNISLELVSFPHALNTIRNSPSVSIFTIRKMIGWE